MSCFGKGMPPLGHSTMALRCASSSVGAHETCSCSSFGTVGLSASRQPSSQAIHRSLTFSSAAPFFFQAEDGIRDKLVTGVQTCALPILGCRLESARRAVRELVPKEMLFVFYNS